MNKQALAFLTLFSLILMLSVYYVTLPNDITAVISEETQQESTKTDDTSSADEEGSTTMQETIEKNLNEQINAATAVMAASDSSESEKQEALAKIEELKNIQQQQKEIESKLSAKKWILLWKSVTAFAVLRSLGARKIRKMSIQQ